MELFPLLYWENYYFPDPTALLQLESSHGEDLAKTQGEAAMGRAGAAFISQSCRDGGAEGSLGSLGGHRSKNGFNFPRFWLIGFIW